MCKVSPVFIHKHFGSRLFWSLADMRRCQITLKALPPLLLIILALTPLVAEGLDLFGRVDDDLSAAGRFLSNEVINGNSSLLLGLQTTLDGLYDYIGDIDT